MDESTPDIVYAARAIGIKLELIRCLYYKHYQVAAVHRREVVQNWDPLNHPEDAMELVTKLRLSIQYYANSVHVSYSANGTILVTRDHYLEDDEPHDIVAKVTREAIVDVASRASAFLVG